MPTQVIMPQLGESVVEGTVSKWLKQEGDSVSEYEALLEVSTDKVDTEIPAPAAGVILKIYVPEGQTVERGTLLAVIGAPGEQPGDAGTPKNSHAPVAQPAPAVANGNGTGHTVIAQAPAQAPASTPAPETAGTSVGHVTPVVARMAAEHNLDLSSVKGSGRDGRVTKKDVEAFLESGGQAAAPAPAAPAPAAEELPPWERPGSGDLFKPSVDYGQPGETPTQPAAVSPAPAPSVPAPVPAAPIVQAPRRVHSVEAIPAGTPGDLVALTPMRRAIAEHMVRSKLETSPHVSTIFEIDLSNVLAHREAHKAEFARQGVNLTLTAYFIAATTDALRATPYLNAEWRQDGIFLHHAIHVGMAVALEEGLIVPVIRNAQDLNLLGLARTINDLATRARTKKLTADEVKGGTFTISNHGVSGSLFATPIINQPQVGILGVGMMEKRVKVINDMLAIRPCSYVSLTFDHRILDGAMADHFMQVLKERLETWA